ncbi:MAG TPA: FdhF/YdeP family oxidoreductase [Blastocatellia bacterium]|jgi:molybdopterin-dependent oxidoreductase alpha subunit|nr:FdhF/YdeP family oxidoreductase [Blastocatellia bacterium]
MSKPKWDRKGWVSLVPNGINQVKPNHYVEMAKVVWRNRDQLPYAWRVLTRGVCDGCALGTTGVRDFTMDGIHLCMVRLDLMRLNTMPALDAAVFDDTDALSRMSASELRELGRLPYPMVRRKGEKGFTRVSWSRALSIAGDHIRRTAPERLAVYMTSRGITNEAYYVAQKAARFLGTNNVDNSSRICHAPSTVALKRSLGVSASTCSYKDWLGTDLLVFFGSNTPNNQPVTTKYIYHAKKMGTRVAVINPYVEPGLERYWVPSVAESALFGTRIADHFYQINTGGDRAFIAGVIKHLVAQGWTDEQFIGTYTKGFGDLKTALTAISWEALEESSGSDRGRMLDFAKVIGQARSAVFVWSMGITQHRNGVENVRAIVDLALTRGFIGREKCGLMPIRGHSGVQGGAEVGAAPNQFPGGLEVNEENAGRLSDLYRFPVPSGRGLNAVEMIDAAHEGMLDLFYIIGGNFLETLPDPDYVRESLERVAVRIHQDIVLSPQMMVEPREAVVLLPAQTRYEQRGGGTETSTERRILFGPEIPGHRIGEALPEWEIPMMLAESAKPDLAHLMHFEDGQAVRDEIARAVPAYEGIQRLSRQGDQVQWGGERLCEETNGAGATVTKFHTEDGLASFSDIVISGPPASGKLRLSTRRGKQFNSIVHRDRDPLNGARRKDVLISAEDARRLGLEEGEKILLRSRSGEMTGYCRISRIRAGNVQVHWPEGNVLIERGVSDPECGIPDFNTEVEVVAL